MAQRLYSSKFIQSFFIQVKIYSVQNLYGTKFIMEKRAIISSEVNGPILWTLFPAFGCFTKSKMAAVWPCEISVVKSNISRKIQSKERKKDALV
jgi:hypothetical protein